MPQHTSAGFTSNITVAHEVEDYAASIAGFGLDAVRTGRGNGPNVSRITTDARATVVSGVVNFPMLGKATLNETTIVITLITSAPPGSRWCGIDIEPGTMMLYGPETLHTGITPAGFGYGFIALPVEVVEEAANGLELKLNLPDRGRVHTLEPTPSVQSLTRLLSAAADPPQSVETAEERHTDAFHAAVAAISVERSARGTHWRSKIDSRDVVHVCVEYASAIERTPTISEMCLVAHVSERRLRTAFTDVLGMPPLRYFRYRSLTNARRGLLNSRVPGHNVGTVASDQGFHNFGRFARHYEATFGELPSATRRMALRGTKRQGVGRIT